VKGPDVVLAMMLLVCLIVAVWTLVVVFTGVAP
jgi:hypothetical protein